MNDIQAQDNIKGRGVIALGCAGLSTRPRTPNLIKSKRCSWKYLRA